MNKQAFAETTCQQIYGKAREVFKQYAGKQGYYGFCILQGPPLFQPPILFVGYQPGRPDDGQQEKEREWENTWPSKCNNATGCWKLSKKLQFMFQRPHLEQCVGVNAIFLRSRNIKTYEKDFAADLSEIKEFCLEQTHKIIEAIDPLKIAVIGFETGILFSKHWEDDLRTEKEKLTLTKVGTIAGKPAVAMRHLTGSRPRISETDLERIRDKVWAR